ncbi:cyclic nucleotide-binding protein [Sphingobacteriaceae bacterium]|nr:cyclic nucleotide-binding protein [Sphingobacteriaceae bacterium]
MTELQQYIHSYFAIHEKDLQTLSLLFKEEILNKGDFYLKSGRPCEKMSFIKSGILRVYVKTPEKEVTQWVSAKASFITDLSGLVFNAPARWNIQALSDCELYTIDKKNYDEIGNLIPRWHEVEKLFIAKCFSMLEDRIFSHLSMSAEERYLLFYEKNKELFNQVPLQYLASMLGMTPETFSRLRKKTLQ